MSKIQGALLVLFLLTVYWMYLRPSESYCGPCGAA